MLKLLAMKHRWISFISIFALSSCMQIASERTIKDDGSFSTGLRAMVSGAEFSSSVSDFSGDDPLNMGKENAKMVEVSDVSEMEKDYHKGSKIYWTNAHDPDAFIPELDDEIFAGKEQKAAWHFSYDSALKRARYENKPVLIWFHDSRYSPPSAKLEMELFNTEAFKTWAVDNVIRLKFDTAEQFTGEKFRKYKSKADDMRRYVKKMHTNFNVRGVPVLMIVSPDGAQINSVKGYTSGQNNFYMDTIKHSANLARIHYKDFKKSLTAKGFRTWTGANGSTFFAKIAKYDDKATHNNIWLALHDGQIVKVSYQNLSAKDKTYFDSIKKDLQPPPQKKGK